MQQQNPSLPIDDNPVGIFFRNTRFFFDIRQNSSFFNDYDPGLAPIISNSYRKIKNVHYKQRYNI